MQMLAELKYLLLLNQEIYSENQISYFFSQLRQSQKVNSLIKRKDVLFHNKYLNKMQLILYLNYLEYCLQQNWTHIFNNLIILLFIVLIYVLDYKVKYNYCLFLKSGINWQFAIFFYQATTQMSETKLQPNTSSLLTRLQKHFPDINQINLPSELLNSPLLDDLSNRLLLYIPIHTLSPQLNNLYQAISQHYYTHFLKVTTSERNINAIIDQNTPVTDQSAVGELMINRPTERKPLRSRINYLDLSEFINKFTPEMKEHVNPNIIEMGKIFNNWQSTEVNVNVSQYKDYNKKWQNKPKRNEQKQTDEKIIKNQTVSIVFGKQLHPEYQKIKMEIIQKARNNKLLTDPQNQPEVERITNEINFILNRLTEQYFNDFFYELVPFARHQVYSIIFINKIIEKILEEHNYIKIYATLIRKLKNELISFEDKKIKFKRLFVQILQFQFNKLVRQRQWQKEQFYKKQLLGITYFIGQLIINGVLSKKIFSDCFYEYINSYVIEYRKYSENKAFFYYQIYVECIVKLIQKMGSFYDELLSSSSKSKIQTVVMSIFDDVKQQGECFVSICDYVQVLKEINHKMPSTRQKITFLLQDLRCNKILKKQENIRDQQQYEIVKKLMKMDPKVIQQQKNILKLIKDSNLIDLMKIFYMQFAEGNSKDVNRHIQTYKQMSKIPYLCSDSIKAFNQSIDALYSIESDFPYLKEGIAKIMKINCQVLKVQIRELQVNFDQSDEDLLQFLEDIEAKYFRLTSED